MKKLMLLGAGELGKEFAISAQRLGLHVVAVDRYEDAPAMQVADEFEVIDMLSAADLERVVTLHKPDILVPEIEAIRTEKLIQFEKKRYPDHTLSKSRSSDHEPRCHKGCGGPRAKA